MKKNIYIYGYLVGVQGDNSFYSNLGDLKVLQMLLVCVEPNYMHAMQDEAAETAEQSLLG